MIMIRPNEWRTQSGALLGLGSVPVSLLSGNRAIYIAQITTVNGYLGAGMPLTTLTVADYIRVLVKNPLNNGNPAHSIPPYYNSLVTAAQS